MIDYRTQIDGYLADMPPNASTASYSTQGGYQHPQPGSRLIHYGMGWNADKTVNPSVIYSNYMGGQNGTPLQLSSSVQNYCRRAGVRRILVGHQPIGDSPFIISSEEIDVQ